jgi:hypothetical protein
LSHSWSSGPPPHERGLSARENEILHRTESDYEYCVIRRNYDMRHGQVWFTAQTGRRLIGRSRLCDHGSIVVGALKRFDRDAEGAYDELVRTLLDNGWEPVGDDQPELVNAPLNILRRRIPKTPS